MVNKTITIIKEVKEFEGLHKEKIGAYKVGEKVTIKKIYANWLLAIGYAKQES